MIFWGYKMFFGMQKTKVIFLGQQSLFGGTKCFSGCKKVFLTFWKVESGKGGVQLSATLMVATKAAAKAGQTTGKAAQTVQTATKSAKAAAETRVKAGSLCSHWRLLVESRLCFRCSF